MRILLTGASGLLGRELKKELEKEHELLALSFSRQGEGLTRCDLTKKKELEEILHNFQPQLIIHAAAERRPDVCERNPQAANALNLQATQHLAQWASSNNSRLLFISTDYVFDGKNPPYQENAKTNPLNSYGKGKLEGEKIILSSAKNALILRVPVLYGPVEYPGESAVLSIFEQLKNAEGKSITLDNWAVRYPTLTSDIAQAVNKLCKIIQKDFQVGGIFHFSASEAMTKYTMALQMKQLAGFNCKITANNQPAAGAPRPQDAHLDCSKLQQLIGDFECTSFSLALKSCLQPFLNSTLNPE